MKPVCGGYTVDGKVKEHKHEASLVTDPGIMRHWGQGPGRVTRLPEPVQKTTVDEQLVTVKYEYRIRLATFPSWRTREEVVDRLNLSLHSSRGWVRAGVWTRFVPADANPHCTLYVVGDDEPTCGPGTSCVQSRNGVVTCHLRDSHLFNIDHFVTNHEFGHAIFMACDMYRYDTVDPSGYRGVMDNGLDKTNWPTAADITDTKNWLDGEAPYIGC